ncbi:MAG: hypothetical protein M1817_002278 [Caeruleum heppii]|nr:MAG: hypothetical protein M1817_002278 [Caeruleum heppii]
MDMSAEVLGRRLLDEVREEGLDQWPSTYHTLPPEPPSLPEKHTKRPLIEIIGSSCGGKTHLLYYIATLAVLPARYHDINLNGKESAVVVIDADGRFDVRRLRQIIRHYVSSLLPADEEQDENDGLPHPAQDGVNELLKTGLSHIHIFRPQSSASLLATLAQLSQYLFHSRAHHLHHRSLGAIMLDSTTAFFWQDKFAEESRQREEVDRQEEANPGGHLPSETSPSSFKETYNTLSTHLLALSSTFPDTPIVITTRILSPVSSSSVFPPSHLPSLFTSHLALRLHVHRDPVPKFGPGMSAEEAGRDQESRLGVVGRGRFSAWVVPVGGEGGMGTGTGRRRVGFWIREEGMGVE